MRTTFTYFFYFSCIKFQAFLSRAFLFYIFLALIFKFINFLDFDSFFISKCAPRAISAGEKAICYLQQYATDSLITASDQAEIFLSQSVNQDGVNPTPGPSQPAVLNLIVIDKAQNDASQFVKSFNNLSPTEQADFRRNLTEFGIDTDVVAKKTAKVVQALEIAQQQPEASVPIASNNNSELEKVYLDKIKELVKQAPSDSQRKQIKFYNEELPKLRDSELRTQMFQMSSDHQLRLLETKANFISNALKTGGEIFVKALNLLNTDTSNTTNTKNR